MRNTIVTLTTHYLIRHFLFWIGFFFFFRLLFVGMNYSFLEGSFLHKLGVFFYALRLDLSTCSFLLALPFLIWITATLLQRPFLLRINRYYHFLLIGLAALICLMNSGNYANWGTVINKRVLLYFKNPAEVTHFMSTTQLILLPIVVVGMIGLWIWIYRRVFPHQSIAVSSVSSGFKNLLFIPLLFLLMRGGLQTVPINESASFYSPHEANCHAAVNPVYYFLHDVSDYYYVSDKFNFMSDEKALKLVEELTASDYTDSLRLTSVEQPNIVIILLESWTADVIEALGGDKGVTPYTDQLLNESILFTNCFGSGYRTDQGLVCVLSGYPSQPDNSIIAYPSKSGSLPSLCEFVKAKNYTSSFFYGGDIGFANMRSFIVQQGFEYISDQADYSASEQNSKWGAHDGKVFSKQIAYLNKQKQPFISALLTLSTHEPFEVPIKHKFPHDSDPNKFRNSAYYTDQCLKAYFNEIKKTEWYKNTLFLLVADHGHHLPRERNMSSPESKRITCIITGGALTSSWRGKKITHAVNQHDMIIPFAELCGMKKNDFPLAKNPFTARHHFAYYSNENVLGWVRDSSVLTYEIKTGKTIGDKDEAAFAKAYLQVLYKDFVSR